MVSFYTDANIPLNAVKQLRLHGIDIVRCEDIGLKTAADPEHLAHAVQEGRILLTCDADFLQLHRKWIKAGKSHPGIVYISSNRQGLIGVIVREILFLYHSVMEQAASAEDFRDIIWYI